MPTLGEARTDLRDRINESSAKFWSDAMLDTWIYEAMRDVARQTECLEAIKSYTVDANQIAYPAPVDMIRIHRAEYRQSASQIIPLEFMPYSDVDDIALWSREATGSQPRWYSWWGFPSSEGGTQIFLYPVSATTVTDGLRVFYYKMPRKPLDDGDPLEIPSGWEDLIPLYAEANARRSDNDPRWKDAYDLYLSRLENLVRVTGTHTDVETFISPAGRGLMGGGGGYGPDWGF